MKNKIFKNIIIFIIFFGILIISDKIYASNFNTVLEVDNSNQKTEEVTLILKLKEVNFENIISTIQGNIEYDRSVFSEVKLENLNNWSIVYNNEENSEGKFIGFKISQEEIKEEELFKITFRINDQINNTKTKISVKNIKSADGDNLVATEDRTIDVQIENGSVTEAKTEAVKLTRKTSLKYILILVIIILLLTISTSTTYLIQKYKYKKKYNQK